MEKYQNTMFLLSTNTSRESVMNAICDNFGIKTEADSNTITLRQEDIEVKIMVAASEAGGEDESYIKEQIPKIENFYYNTESTAVDIKTNLLYHIGLTKIIVIVDYTFEEGYSEDKKEIIHNMFNPVLFHINSILLTMDDEKDIYCCSPTGERYLLYSGNGTSDLSGYLPRQVFTLEPDEYINQEQIDRRLKNLGLIEKKYIYVPAWYPVIESECDAICRTKEEVAGRAVSLLIVALYSECLLGEGMSRQEAVDFITPIIAQFQADQYFSPKEKEYLDSEQPSEQDKITFSWQYENLYIMEWALGLIDNLDFPDHICDVGELVRQMKRYSSILDLIERSDLRANKELLDECDYIFCLDWACVDTRIRSLPAPVDMIGGVVMERHKSLNWLIGSDESAAWDDVSTST